LLHARVFFFFQAEDGIRDRNVTGVQTCALPISSKSQVSVAHCSPTWLHVPQLSPYSAALSSKRSLSPSFSPPTDSQSAVKEASGSAYGARFPVSSAPSAGGICTGSWFVFRATSAARP